MANCENCGGLCCRALRLRYNMPEIKQRARQYPGSDASFAAKYFKRISVAKAIRINPQIIKMLPIHNYEGYFYECKLLNKKTGLCMEYQRRPDVCRNYPVDGETWWYTPNCALKSEAITNG